MNPLTVELREPSYTCADAILAANRPFVVPLELTICKLHMHGIVALVVRSVPAPSTPARALIDGACSGLGADVRQVDKSSGTTLSFKYDPLERVVVSSTFDKVASVQRFLQQAIERQLRTVFVEDLPRLIHSLSLKRAERTSTNAEAREGGGRGGYVRACVCA